MSQVFTVNNIAFEVAKDIYKQHFIMGNIEENDRFVDVHNYIIEASDTEDMLKAGIQAIIDHLDASGEKYCPITGMKYGYIKGFEVAGADKKFHFAKAIIVNDKITVFSDEVPQPVAVRYNWCDDASEGNLFNKENFPAAPFRTDNWDGITLKNKYSVY